MVTQTMSLSASSTSSSSSSASSSSSSLDDGDDDEDDDNDDYDHDDASNALFQPEPTFARESESGKMLRFVFTLNQFDFHGSHQEREPVRGGGLN